MASPLALPHPLPGDAVDLLSERLALLGDPTRIRILDVLRGGEHNVQAIADSLVTTQQNVSGHLRLLRAAGVLSRRPVGREVFYAVEDETVFGVWEQALVGLRPQPPPSSRKTSLVSQHSSGDATRDS